MLLLCYMDICKVPLTEDYSDLEDNTATDKQNKQRQDKII